MFRHKSLFLEGEIFFFKYNMYLFCFICFYMSLDFEKYFMKRLENKADKLICFAKEAKFNK